MLAQALLVGLLLGQRDVRMTPLRTGRSGATHGEAIVDDQTSITIGMFQDCDRVHGTFAKCEHLPARRSFGRQEGRWQREDNR